LRGLFNTYVTGVNVTIMFMFISVSLHTGHVDRQTQMMSFFLHFMQIPNHIKPKENIPPPKGNILL